MRSQKVNCWSILMRQTTLFSFLFILYWISGLSNGLMIFLNLGPVYRYIYYKDMKSKEYQWSKIDINGRKDLHVPRFLFVLFGKEFGEIFGTWRWFLFLIDHFSIFIPYRIAFHLWSRYYTLPSHNVSERCMEWIGKW